MLAKLKRPSLYINHGVWLFKDGRLPPIKRKILSLDFTLTQDKTFSVKRLFVDGVGWCTPEVVYMTRAETLPMCINVLKRDLAIAVEGGSAELKKLENERIELEQRLEGWNKKVVDVREKFNEVENSLRAELERARERLDLYRKEKK